MADYQAALGLTDYKVYCMVEFSEEVITEITSAGAERELRNIIDNSFIRLSSMNIYNKENYLINMIVSLQAKKAEHPSQDVLKNINNAIEIFREHRRRNQGLLF